MTNIQAAILLGQIEVLSTIVEKKQNLFNFYRENLLKIDNVELQEPAPNTTHSNWMMGVKIKNKTNFYETRDHMLKNNIDIRPMFYPMSSHKHLKKYARQKEEKRAQRLSEQCFMIPSYPDLTKGEAKHIVKTIGTYCG